MSRTPRPALSRTLRGAAAVTAGLAVAVVPIATLATSATAASATTTVAKGCATGALPTDVAGKPAAYKHGLPAGAWVWHDKNGFHLRVTHDSKAKLTFTGSIKSSGKITAHRVYAEKNDVLWRNNAHTAVKFTLRNYGGTDGIDFKVGCAKTVTIYVKAHGTKLGTTQIHLGRTQANPTANPVVIQRSVPAV